MSGPTYPPPGGQPPMGPPWPGPQGPHPQQPVGTWPGPPPGAPQGNRRWLLLALAFLAVIAVSVACTVWFTHKGSGGQASGGGSQASGGSSGEIASAGDTGPVGIITEDPTCDKWISLTDDVGAKTAVWGKRDASVPATAWTSDQRQMYESTARVFRAQADQALPLARQTPHRVVRELYEQLIAYRRAYADAIANYRPEDDLLALTGNSLAGALLHICTAITNLSAIDRGSSVPAAAPPTSIAPIGDLPNPERFLKSPSPVCSEMRTRAKNLDSALAAWYQLPNVAATQWSPGDRKLWDEAAQILTQSADEAEHIGRTSGNPVIEDFLVLSAQYHRAYAKGIPSFSPPDAELYEAGQSPSAAVSSACKALGG